MSVAAGSSSDDDDFQFESATVGTRRYPVHDCCEFEDAEALRRLILVPQDNSDDANSSTGSSDGSSTDENEMAAAHAAAMGHSPAVGKSPNQGAAAGMVAMPQVETNGDTKASETDVKEVTEEKEGTGDDQAEPEESQDAAATATTTSENDQAGEPMDTGDDTASKPIAKADDGPTGETGQEKKPNKEKETRYYCPYDINERDGDEITALHVAIHNRKLEHVKLLLQAGASPHRKSDGSAPIHTAISVGGVPGGESFALECVQALVEYDADITVKDESHHTPLSIACMMNHAQVVTYILSTDAGRSTLNARCDRQGGRALHVVAKFDAPLPASPATGGAHAPFAGGHHHPDGTVVHSAGHHIPGMHAGGVTTGDASAAGQSVASQWQGDSTTAVVTQILVGVPGIEVDARNMLGQTPLHIACSKGNWPVVRVLLRAGASPDVQDGRGFTPGQLAHKRGMPVPADLLGVLGESSPEYPARDLILDPDGSTLVMCHELCMRHHSCPPIRRDPPEPPPENVRRLHVLINDHDGILRTKEFERLVWEGKARRAAMGDVLKVHEYNYVEAISQLCSSIPDHPSAIAHLDPDTALSRWSFEAALRAAGSVCDAVDRVMMSHDFRNAFCAVRPPGHHAGPRGIVRCANDPEGGSHGFCLLNNVAIGAAYARCMYRNEGIRKIAIVDFDVHHGNGTEEVIRHLVPGVETTVIRTPFATGELSTQKYRPWLDETDVNDVFFASTHGFGPRGSDFGDLPQQQGWFYPASGKTHTSDAILNPSLVETPNVQDFILSQSWTRMGEESKANCCKIINCGLGLPGPDAIPGMQRLELRDTYRKKILPHLREFDPDLIFISAGFDGHKRDTMNFGYVGMVEEDYEWVTEQLVKVANTCCEGRIISVLEGGYKIHGGIVSPFARSVASHVRALVDGGRNRELYQAKDSEWESQFERHVVEDRERKRQQKADRLRMARLRLIRAAEQQQVTGSVEHEEVDALMKAPLNENEQLDAAVVAAVEEPSRKRRRPNVDYKKLLEEMKHEGGGGGDVAQ